jgi:hypothetical protein
MPLPHDFLTNFDQCRPANKNLVFGEILSRRELNGLFTRDVDWYHDVGAPLHTDPHFGRKSFILVDPIDRSQIIGAICSGQQRKSNRTIYLVPGTLLTANVVNDDKERRSSFAKFGECEELLLKSFCDFVAPWGGKAMTTIPPTNCSKEKQQHSFLPA